LAPFVTLSVNVPTGVTVSGSIGCVKVALNRVPVTTLPEPLVPVATFVALLLGLAEPTVGLMAAAPGSATAGAAAVPPPPLPPHPARNTHNSNIINQPQDAAEPRLQLLILSP
jgi:hypothetical protein